MPSMDRHLFAKKRVSLAVSMALGAVTAIPAVAQESESANDQIMEEVVVTGIRSSLKRAMDTKRDATGVVDAITAEDIGDFPDTNLAEALQRITGVAIDRNRGEGARVTVRGFRRLQPSDTKRPSNAKTQWFWSIIRLRRYCLRGGIGR